MHYPRWFAKLWAAFFGYFWLPCPLCGRDFGGHESALRGICRPGSARGQLVCWRCEARAYRILWGVEPFPEKLAGGVGDEERLPT